MGWYLVKRGDNFTFMFFFKKALTILRGPLAYPNGLIDLHIETFGRTPWPGDQPDIRPLPTQDNTTQKHADTHPCPKQDSNLRSQCGKVKYQHKFNHKTATVIKNPTRFPKQDDQFHL
jgi:hypothetical protein